MVLYISALLERSSRRRKKKKSSDNRVISGFPFFLFRSILTHILPFIVRLFDFCTCANAAGTNPARTDIQIHGYLYLHIRAPGLEEELSEETQAKSTVSSRRTIPNRRTERNFSFRRMSKQQVIHDDDYDYDLPAAATTTHHM